MTSEKIEEAVQETVIDAGNDAAEIIDNAETVASEIHHSTHESVASASEAVEEAAEQVQNMQKELEWKQATQAHLMEMKAQIQTLTEQLQTIPAQLAEQMAATQTAILAQMTPPSPPVRENAVDLPAENGLNPMEQAEKQPPSKKRKATFL